MIIGCTFEFNNAIHGGSKGSHTPDGGAIYCGYLANPTILSCAISNNTADDLGGGIHCQDKYKNNPTIANTTICGNSPDQVYGEYVDGGGNEINDNCIIDCPADINGDGYVDVSDLLNIIDQWGLTNSPADVNEDGMEDVFNVKILLYGIRLTAVSIINRPNDCIGLSVASDI